jgi:pseudo-rSAM protein
MKHLSENKKIYWLFLEPFAHSVTHGNNVLIYNSITGRVIEYQDAPGLSKLMSDLDNSSTGFTARIDPDNETREVRDFISDLRNSHSGDLIKARNDIRPVVIHPRPILVNYPPPTDFPDFNTGDYLKNIYFNLNASETPADQGYIYAMYQFPCLAFNSAGYIEMPAADVLNRYLPFDGISGIGIDLTGADITRYRELDALIPYLKKLISPITFHIPLPCHDPSAIEKIIRLKNSRISFYITLPYGPSVLPDILNNTYFQKKKNHFDFNFIIRSLEEYNLINGVLAETGLKRFFFLPYYSKANLEFFKENIFLAKNDILGSKPDQRQVYSRQVLNDPSFGKLYIMPGGEVFSNMNEEPLGNIYNETIPDLVKKEIYTGKGWNLNRMHVQPCSACLYRFLCPPIGNYERFMQRFNFCDILYQC